MSEVIKVIIYGCGVMGKNAARVLFDKESFEVVGAVDINSELIGKDLGEVLGLQRTTGIIVEKDADELFSKVKAHAVIHTTTSHLEKVFPQLSQCIKAGFNVVSTCEELSFPLKRHPQLSRDLDNLANKYGVTVVGTGINPGYLMDTLPLMLSAPCLKVDSVKVIRMMDSSKRRIPFQEKVGTGLTKEEFREKIDNKVITGHVGLLESIYMIADGLGWKLDGAVELPPEPVVVERDIETALGTVNPGDVVGLTSVAYGLKQGKKIITLEFNANASVEEEYDEIIIEGEPNIHEKIIGGVHGDTGTIAVTVNTVPRAVQSSPGLKLMKDLPVPSATL